MQKRTNNSEKLSREIKKRKQAEQNLKERLIFEELLSDLSARFVNLPADQVDGEIENAQRRVCELLDLAVVWQLSMRPRASSRLPTIIPSSEGLSRPRC